MQVDRYIQSGKSGDIGSARRAHDNGDIIGISLDGSKITPVIVASLVVFPTLFTMFYSALSGIDKAYVEGVWLEGGGRLSIIRYVYVPFMHTSLIEGAGSGLSLSLKLVVSAEAIAQTALSIGAMMKQASAEFDPATLLRQLS